MPVEYHRGAFPPTALDWNALIPLLGPTSAAIARYDGVLAAIPDPTLLLSPLTSQEAVLSSSIEGTHATMGEVLSLEAGAEELLPENRRGDIAEVFNYRVQLAVVHAEFESLHPFLDGNGRWAACWYRSSCGNRG